MKQTKKDKIEHYLNGLMESDNFTIDDLLELTVEELRKVPQLKQIGKITISTVLAEYKSKYEDDFFNDIDDEIMSEVSGSGDGKTENRNKSFPFTDDEIQALKILLGERAEKRNPELIELKLALKNAGIDYMMLLKDYRTQKEVELKEWEETTKVSS